MKLMANVSRKKQFKLLATSAILGLGAENRKFTFNITNYSRRWLAATNFAVIYPASMQKTTKKHFQILTYLTKEYHSHYNRVSQKEVPIFENSWHPEYLKDSIDE